MTKTQILKILSDNGYKAYLVGGCVRDLVLKKTPNDFDIATSALPRQVSELFFNSKLVLSGQKHGTIGIVCDEGLVEVTTFRKESTYSDFRHPDQVVFTKELKEDLARRDFTCNAMAMDADGIIIDIFGGQNDIQNKLIRCVGDADKRFLEDALRILRAVRFAAQCDFEIEQNTLASACALSKNLHLISKERIFEELKKTFKSQYCHKIMQQTLPIFSSIFPSLQKDAWQQICTNISQCRQNIYLSLACILKHCDFLAELNHLKADSKTKNTVLFLLTNSLEDRRDIIKKIGVRGFENVCLLGEFITINDKSISKDLLKTIFACKDELCSAKQLKIDGNTVKSLGISDKNIGFALNFLLNACIDKKCNNTQEELLNYLEISIDMFK